MIIFLHSLSCSSGSQSLQVAVKKDGYKVGKSMYSSEIKIGVKGLGAVGDNTNNGAKNHPINLNTRVAHFQLQALV